MYQGKGADCVPTCLHLCHHHLVSQKCATYCGYLKLLEMRKCWFLGQEIFRAEEVEMLDMLLDLWPAESIKEGTLERVAQPSA